MENTISNLEENSISELIKVIALLRDPIKGCPWDLEQTHSSLIPFVLEEAHEVTDAIREGNDEHLVEELGDLLLQVVLHSQIASEEKRFCLNDVIDSITKKLIRRHPHVFGNHKLTTKEEVNKKWEEIKLSETQLESSTSPISDRLKNKSRSQPAIAGAMYISKKVAKIGFEWPTVDAVWKKFDEEINEFKDALTSQNRTDSQEELGDVLFTLINIARWYKIDPEEGLSGTNNRFLKRFAYIEKKVEDDLSKQSTEQLAEKWKEAKKALQKK